MSEDNGYIVTKSARVDEFLNQVLTANPKQESKQTSSISTAPNEEEFDQTKWFLEWKDLVVIQDYERLPYHDMILHGIPDVLRGPAWKWLSRSDERLDQPSKTFSDLVEQSFMADKEIRVAIDKDIRRTFPRHVLFETRHGQEQLSQVLCAYAAIDPHVGYCQGMGFIAAFLLCYLSPEDAFWLLQAVMCRPEYDLRSMLSPGMPKFAPAMRELTRFIEIVLPEVARKLSHFGIDPSIFASQWFITLFSYNMPFQLVARVWDLFFLRRWSVVFRVSVVLLELVQEELVDANDMEVMLNVLKSIPDRIRSQHQTVDAMIERAMRLNVDEDDARVLGNIANSESEEMVLAD